MQGARAALQTIADALVTAGVNATTDIRAVSAPAVLLERPVDRVPSMCGTTITASAWLIAPGPFSANAWDALEALVDAVVPLVPAWTHIYYQRVYEMGGEAFPAVEIEFALETLD